MYGLSPLDPDTAGIELFLERATERDHRFAPTESDLEHIRQICARLDGIPLGIELASAWVRVLSPSELVDRLQDRFRVLRGGRSGGRHQTLLDTVLWSYEQLTEPQARLFDRLSVFAGGFSLGAVEAVCADEEIVDSLEVLELMMTLVDKSMVQTVRGVGHVRFTLLGTLRQFGQEQLDASGDSDTYRKRHADYFGALAVSQASSMISPNEAEVWTLLDHEWANLRAALETGLATRDFDSVVELVLELGWYAALSMRFELFAWIDELFDEMDVDSHADASSLYGLRAVSAYFTVDSASADYANKGLEIDPVDPFGYCRLALSSVALNNELSAEHSAQLTTAWLEHVDDDSPVINRMLAEGMRTFHLCANEPSPEAAEHAQTLLDLASSSRSATASGLAAWAGGMVATFEGIEGGLAQWRAGLDKVQSLHQSHLVQDLIVGLILHFTVSHGDLDEVLASTLSALERANDNHYNAGTSHLFGVSAIALCRTGREDTAAKLLGAMVANGHSPRRNAARAVDKALGAGAEQAQALGAGLSINDAAALAMAELRASIMDQQETP